MKFSQTVCTVRRSVTHLGDDAYVCSRSKAKYSMCHLQLTGRNKGGNRAQRERLKDVYRIWSIFKIPKLLSNQEILNLLLLSFIWRILLCWLGNSPSHNTPTPPPYTHTHLVHATWTLSWGHPGVLHVPCYLWKLWREMVPERAKVYSSGVACFLTFTLAVDGDQPVLGCESILPRQIYW